MTLEYQEMNQNQCLSASESVPPLPPEMEVLLELDNMVRARIADHLRECQSAISQGQMRTLTKMTLSRWQPNNNSNME